MKNETITNSKQSEVNKVKVDMTFGEIMSVTMKGTIASRIANSLCFIGLVLTMLLIVVMVTIYRMYTVETKIALISIASIFAAYKLIGPTYRVTLGMSKKLFPNMYK